MTENELCKLAVEAMKNSYSPYSDCKVGAALLCDDGAVYTGCNIENAAFGPTVCAERVAIFKAVSDGKRAFTAIAVAGGKNGKVNGVFAPCGVCRQVLREFCDDDFKIYMAESESTHITATLPELLPQAFKPENVSARSETSRNVKCKE